ncbi:hypothetical protein AJ80_09039 [Polytolypa hystricis UAMH7299]|uniref:Very long-chain fatty acid transport protein n=1 Tax=Polytolypa hystricis (strain UAMH7299) TaxID=1447883 RepID=A0A2B7WX29_POLH7|nr:hypothetical protein AJ80_09039 [Polytolypa hystricis UAMH7299]
MDLTATSTAAAAGGLSVLAAYLDAKYHLSQDLTLIRRMKLAQSLYLENEKANRLSLWYVFNTWVDKSKNATCIWSRQRTYTWQQVHTRAVQYARYFLSRGIKPGDLVAFYLMNSPDFAIIWLGLWCIGCAPVLVNYNLKSKSLVHCLRLAEAKILLVDSDKECQQRVEGVRNVIEMDLGMGIALLDSALEGEIDQMDTVVPDDTHRQHIKGTSPVCILYTSGTTGFPKAAALPTQRAWSLACHKDPGFGMTPGRDRYYVCVPMFHGTGGVSAMGGIIAGMSIAIGRRFSVSTFWDDIHDSESTMFIYVGEAARYLLNAPPSRYERDHPKLRLMYGNGLRPDVWQRFRERFDVPEIAEFFNSTEGLFALLNHNRGDFTATCVGHHGAILRKFFSNTYIPVATDPHDGAIYRDRKTGFAKRMPYEVGGEILVSLPTKQSFPGYLNNESETSKKILTNVFRKGDMYYRTGDALRRDADGRWFFLDRLGDTFRWKSENVSTAEVSEVLGRFPGVAEANVYGVLVPGHEGRAGCVALSIVDDTAITTTTTTTTTTTSSMASNTNASNQDIPRGWFDFNGFLAHARRHLPKYAIPVFVRLVASTSSTDNLKQSKVPLREEGIDFEKLGSCVGEKGKGDRFLWLKPGRVEKGKGYVEFSREDLAMLRGGKVVL